MFDLPPTFNQPLIAIVIQETPLSKTDSSTPPKTHTVVAGDTLTSIALAHSTTVQRLYDKNPDISSPDVIEVGQTLVIPTPDEELVNRPLPVETPSIGAVRRPQATSGNLYTAGQCTAYAKDRRPDLPNSLGSANTWYSRAKAQGIPVGSVPKVGAIAWAKTGYMHVAYVERVNGDGTIFISEQNYKGRYVVSTRTAPASDFLYIY